MTEPYEIIRRIQSDYFALLDCHFKVEREALNMDHENPDHLWGPTRKLAAAGPTVSTEGRTLRAVTYKSLQLIRDLHSFWATSCNPLYESIAQIPHMAIHAKSSPLTLKDEVRSTAL